MEKSEKEKHMDREIRQAVSFILQASLTTGNGSYVSEFGPVTYSQLVRFYTKGDKGYCFNNGHTPHTLMDRCIICNESL